jgi:hypothetical protein
MGESAQRTEQLIVQGMASMLLKDKDHERFLHESMNKLQNEELLKRVLQCAGNMAQEQGNPLEAVFLFCYNNASLESALSVLNKEMAKAIKPPHSDRRLWKEEAEKFSNKYSCPNLPQLERNTFETLLNLLKFYISIDERRWDDALIFVNNLLPIKDDPSEIRDYLTKHRDLQERVREVFPQVFTDALHVLRQSYEMHRNDSNKVAMLEDRFRAFEKFNARLAEPAPQVAQMIARFPL